MDTEPLRLGSSEKFHEAIHLGPMKTDESGLVKPKISLQQVSISRSVSLPENYH